MGATSDDDDDDANVGQWELRRQYTCVRIIREWKIVDCALEYRIERKNERTNETKRGEARRGTELKFTKKTEK